MQPLTAHGTWLATSGVWLHASTLQRGLSVLDRQAGEPVATCVLDFDTASKIFARQHTAKRPVGFGSTSR